MKKLLFVLIAAFLGVNAHCEDLVFCDGDDCWDWDKSANIVGGCSEQNKTCPANTPDKSIESKCIKVKVKNTDTVKQWTCSAQACADNYLLWFDAKGHNQGVCHKESLVIRSCKENGDCKTTCGEGYECQPKYRADMQGRPNRAYQACECVKVDEPIEDEWCGIKCGNTYLNKTFACKDVATGNFLTSNKCIKDGNAFKWKGQTSFEATDESEEGKNLMAKDAKGHSLILRPSNTKSVALKGHIAYDVANLFKMKIKGEVIIEDDKCYFHWNAVLNCPNSLASYHEYIKLQLNKADCGLEYEQLVEKYKASFEKAAKVWESENCNEEIIKPNATDLEKAVENVNSFFEYTKGNLNVWRDRDGNFNTTRLISDTTAGVVLGTVGGIVSGKVIKKKQLEKGFDVLHCVVGGQKMADYGDTFQVSFYR